MSGVSKVNKKSNLEKLLKELFEVENEKNSNTEMEYKEDEKKESFSSTDQEVLDSLKKDIEEKNQYFN